MGNVEIDGSVGGGSILRVATGVATVLNASISVRNIRKGRKNPGIQAQHLAGLEGIALLTEGMLKGAKVGSMEVEFTPGRKWAKQLAIKIPTAGAISLALQPLVISCLALPHQVEVKISGGATFGKWAPPVPYWQNVLLPLLSRFRTQIEVHILKHGFYPVGGGKILSKLFPTPIAEPIELRERGEIRCFQILSVAAEALRKRKVGERMAETAEKQVRSAFHLPVFSTIEYVDADSPGCGIIVWAECEKSVLGTDGIGELGKPAEKVAEEAVKKLMEDLKTKAALDQFLSDQILPFLAFRGGFIRIPRITEHIQILPPMLEQLASCRFHLVFPYLYCEREK